MQSCERRLQVPQLGLDPSHRSFLFRHKTHAIRFGLLDASFCASPVGDLLSLSPVCCARSLKKLSSGDSESGEGIVGGLMAIADRVGAPFSLGCPPRKQSATRADYRRSEEDDKKAVGMEFESPLRSEVRKDEFGRGSGRIID